MPSPTPERFQVLIRNVTDNTPEPPNRDDDLDTLLGADPVAQLMAEVTDLPDRIQAALDLATGLAIQAGQTRRHPELAHHLNPQEVGRRADAISSLLEAVIRSRAETDRIPGCQHTFPCPERLFCNDLTDPNG